MSRVAELAEEPLRLTSPVLYALFDGLFQRGLLKHLSGDASAIEDMQADVKAAIGELFGPGRRTA
jgi:hypothetical protein